MDTRPSALPQDDWLAHAQALRRLARGLVRDGNEVEDLLQEVWLRSERAGQRSRSWLSAVLRNLLRDRARAQGRRTATEREAARAEGVPSGAEIVERLEVAERLARELAALEEPLRVALHLRYFEDLGPEEIAARLGQPLETTRTQLRRGLARLRERMDRAHGGDRRAWALALAPLARDGTAAGTTTAGTLLAAGTKTLGMLMGTKLVLGTATVGLAALGCLLWLRRPETAAPAALSPAREAEIVAALAPALPPTEPRVAEREELASGPTPAPAAPAAAPRVVEGTVVIADEQGTEFTAEDGTLTLATGTSEADAKVRELAFEDGRFSFELAEGNWVAFARLVARDREALLPKVVPLVPGHDPMVVRGQWLKRGRLRVIDAATRAELSGIELRCAEGWRANPEWTHPGDDARVRTVIADGVSPLELPDRKWYTPYWVHAPGYAWTRIDFEHKTGGERTVELSTARATVEVTTDAAAPAAAFARLYEVAPPPRYQAGIQVLRPPIEERPSWMAAVSVRLDPAEPTRIDDLAPGKYLAAIEVGEYEDRLRLGSAEVELVDGQMARVRVPVEVALLDLPRTHLFGTIRIPEGLVREGCGLRIERLDGGQKEFLKPLRELGYWKGQEDTLLWDAGPMRTGTYLATITGLQHRLVIEAERAGGETRVDIEIPPLVTVSVEVVDAATGAPLAPERLQWSDGPLPGISRNTSTPISRSPATGALEFVAPHGPVEVYAVLAGYKDANQELELTGNEAHVRLELQPETGIRLLAREGPGKDGALLPVDREFWRGILVHDDGGELVQTGTWGVDGGALLRLWPGRFTLTIPALPGFRALEPIEVEVRADEVVECVLAFERAP